MPAISVSITDEAYEALRTMEKESPTMSRSAIVSAAIIEWQIANPSKPPAGAK